MADPLDQVDLTLKAESLYRERSYTDLAVGTLRHLIPVTPEGVVDASREELFQGQTQLMTQAGALPIHFDIPAQTLAEAVAGFAAAARQGVQDTLAQIEAMRREQASSLVLPGQQGSGPPTGLKL